MITLSIIEFCGYALIVTVVASTRMLVSVGYTGYPGPEAVGSIIQVGVSMVACVCLNALNRMLIRIGNRADAETGRMLLDASHESIHQLTLGEVFLQRLAPLHRRIRHSRIRYMLFAAYLASASAVPAIATLSAVSATQGSWLRLESHSAARVPVYWNGDRLVYLTFEPACYVHVQIAGVEQARRTCPPLMREVTLP